MTVPFILILAVQIDPDISCLQGIWVLKLSQEIQSNPGHHLMSMVERNAHSATFPRLRMDGICQLFMAGPHCC